MSTTTRRRRCSSAPRAQRKEDSTAEPTATRQRDRGGGGGGKLVGLFAQGWSIRSAPGRRGAGSRLLKSPPLQYRGSGPGEMKRRLQTRQSRAGGTLSRGRRP